MSAINEQFRQIAEQRGLTEAAVVELANALYRGKLKKASFNHRDLGGVGLWGRGQVIIGDMRNEALRARIKDALNDLVPVLEGVNLPQPTRGPDSTMVMPWWNDITLGRPVLSGVYEQLTYGYFLESHRVIVREGDVIRHYDAVNIGVLDIDVTFGERGTPIVTLVTIDGNVSVASLPEIEL